MHHGALRREPGPLPSECQLQSYLQLHVVFVGRFLIKHKTGEQRKRANFS
jgi:hypothetical protein